ncbi:DNA-binding protein [Streptomyces purpureus]|uniref:WD40 repeat domain-containing protein n=1 Tax=Streptomyces purpureus TaxID=1951 RepID=UPI00379F2247
MGRREKPVDPAGGPVQRFAFELRKLRQEAGGPSYRSMAQRAGFSVTALSQAAAGEKLPSLAVTLAYVEACDGDRADWEERWRAAEREEAGRPAPEADDDAQPPYQGLARFDPADEDHFFGRGSLTDALVEHVAAHRVTVVFGPSGSGKSSLLRAGLIPRLSRAENAVERPAALRILTPGARPLRTHRQLFTPAEGEGDTWLIVDQFEEVFTLCQDPDERTGFVDLLLAAGDPGSRLRVVLGVRADFYGRCLEHRGLAAAVADAGVPVGPLSPAELREVVVKPAAAAGLVVERTLTARLVEEADGEPGSLPLLSHALLETWRHRRGRTLTLETYETIGGLQGAVARTAEAAYTRLSPDQGELARRILLRLITPGDGTPDTRRPVDRAEVDTGDDAALVLDRLARARLITLDERTVDLAHEALITSWPRLRGWIDADRERIRLHRRLTEAALAWDELGRDPGALFRGSRLAASEDAFPEAERPRTLTPLEGAFLTAALAARDDERRAAARTARRLRTFAVSVSVLLVIALVAGVLAWQQNRSNERLLVQAEARRIAALADDMRGSDPRTAMRLSVAAWQLADLPETRSALYGAGAQRGRKTLRIPGSTVPDLMLSADGRTALSEVGGRIDRWDVPSQRRVSSVPSPWDEASPLAVSPDGRRAVAGKGGALHLWDLVSGRSLGEAVPGLRMEYPGVGQFEFGPSGRTLVVDDQEGEESQELRLRVWDIDRRQVLADRPIPRDAGEGVGDSWTYTHAVSPDDSLLALCVTGHPLELWDLRRDRQLHGGWEKVAGAADCGSRQMVLAPDGRRLALTDSTGSVVWDVRSGRRSSTVGHPNLTGVEFSADGKFLVATDEEELLVWRLGADSPVFRHALGNERAGAFRIDQAGRTLTYLTGATQGVVRTLDLGHAVAPDWGATATSRAELSPDGKLMATVHHGKNRNSLRLTDVRTRRTLADLPTGPCPKDLDPAVAATDGCAESEFTAFSADSRYFAYGAIGTGPRRPVSVIDTRDPLRATVLPLAPEPADDVADIGDLALGPGGRRLYATRTSDGERIEVWDVRRKARVRQLVGSQGDITSMGQEGRAAAVRPDGRLLVAAARWGPLAWVNDPDTRRATHPLLTQDLTTTIAFSPDGKRLAAGDIQGNVTLWDGEVARRIAEFTPSGAEGASPVRALAFSPDGTLLAAGDDLGGLRLWEATGSGGPPLGSPLSTGGDPILSLAFSADGTRLHAAGAHVPLLSYAVTPRDVAAEVSRRAGGPLTEAEWKVHVRSLPYRRLS